VGAATDDINQVMVGTRSATSASGNQGAISARVAGSRFRDCIKKVVKSAAALQEREEQALRQVTSWAVQSAIARRRKLPGHSPVATRPLQMTAPAAQQATNALTQIVARHPPLPPKKTENWSIAGRSRPYFQPGNNSVKWSR